MLSKVAMIMVCISPKERIVMITKSFQEELTTLYQWGLKSPPPPYPPVFVKLHKK
jgi:hypothetical protein